MWGVYQVLLSLAATFALWLNTALLCDYPKFRTLRCVYLAISGPLALAVAPAGLAGLPKSLCVQIGGVYAELFMKAIEYGVIEDPSPTPRTYWSYLIFMLRDIFLTTPNDRSSSASAHTAAPTGTHEAKAGGTDRSKDEVGKADEDETARRPASGQEQQPPSLAAGVHPEKAPPPRRIRRPPLAAPGSSYPAAVGRILYDAARRYILYDCLLTLCLKPLVGAGPDGASAGAAAAGPEAARALLLPPLLSLRSVLASAVFAACLYLHFAITYPLLILVLSLVWPSLPYTCTEMFVQPWRGLTSVPELWQRWHQLFRTSFLRLAYRPARRAARWLRLRLRLTAAPPGAGKEAAGKAAGKAAGNATGGGGGSGAGVEEAAGAAAVFLLSGLVHEYMCWAAFGTAQGWQLAFFLAHGAAGLLMQAATRARGGGGGGGGSRREAAGRRPAGFPLGGVASAAFCMVSSVLFMRPWLEGGSQRDFWHPVSPVGWALRRLLRVWPSKARAPTSFQRALGC